MMFGLIIIFFLQSVMLRFRCTIFVNCHRHIYLQYIVFLFTDESAFRIALPTIRLAVQVGLFVFWRETYVLNKFRVYDKIFLFKFTTGGFLWVQCYNQKIARETNQLKNRNLYFIWSQYSFTTTWREWWDRREMRILSTSWSWQRDRHHFLTHYQVSFRFFWRFWLLCTLTEESPAKKVNSNR